MHLRHSFKVRIYLRSHWRGYAVKTQIIITNPVKTSEPIIHNGGPLRWFSRKLQYNCDIIHNPYLYWYETRIYPDNIKLHELFSHSTIQRQFNWQYYQQNLNVSDIVNDRLSRLLCHTGDFN